MPSKAEQLTRWRLLRALRGVALVFLILAALFTNAQIAEAAGTPKQLIIFTDKKVYTDWVFSQDKRNTNAPNIIESATQYDLVFYVYAVVLDDDGNVMKGRTSYLSGTINDIAQLDHYNKGSATTHHSNVSDPNLISGALSFKDDGTVTGDVAGDGIYSAVYNPTDFADSWGASNVAGDDHYKINVTVTDNNMGKTVYTYVLLSGIRCHQGYTHGSTHMDGIMPGGVDNCAVCHPGYEHFYESISGTIPDSMRDVHSMMVQEPGVISDDRGFGDFVWNTSYSQVSSLTGVDWKTYWPGSGYCPFCHTNSAGTVLDYSGGDRTPAPLTKPSCSETSSFYGSCHPATEIAGASVVDWLPSAATTVKRQNYDISSAKSHNHTSNKANVSCALCHGGSHALTMPNMSADISSSGNLNDQCILCHNITGGLNITANGGRNENHTNPNCKACHIDQNMKLDTHLVPIAGIPNANCTECHDLGGISPYHIDFSVFNRSDYVHNQYNVSTGMRPLNFNASNGSALRASDNKICWGCHGDDPNNDGKANFSEQPADKHPTRYINSRTCEECHQNSSAPWHAPQNVAHSYNTSEVKTPGAPNCYDCHGQPVMFNNSHKDPDYIESNPKGLKASYANHYGTGFPELAKKRGSNGYCVKYCHQNTSSPFLLEFYNEENMQRPNHSAMTTRPRNQSCREKECHAADAIHDEKMRKPTLSSGTFGNGNCTAPGCHSPSDSGGFNYSYHNNVVNCTSCHMDNIGANIHPIKYLQNDGKDFAQVSLTAASCKLCHKNSLGTETMNRWGVTPRTIGSQHHSNDPENGSKWNKTIVPYWNYMPNEITFVSGWVNNSYRGFITNFDAMKDTNYSAGKISENTTEDSLVGRYPSNHDFNVTVQAGGWFANGTATTLSWSALPQDGNPNGSLIVGSATKGQIVDAIWTAAFVYNKTSMVADASIKLDSKLVKAINLNPASLKSINVTIEDNYGNTTEVFNRSLPDVPEIDWNCVEKSIPNPNAVFWKNASLDHTYNVSIRTRWTGLGGKVTPDIKVAYDNVFVNVLEVDYKKYNFTFYINNTPPSDRYALIVGYQTHVEPARLYVLNGSSFRYRTDLDSGAFTKAIIPLSNEEYGSGNVTLRINDSNGPGETTLDVNEIDVKPDYIDIEYMFIDSYRWINNSRVNYPCEYCHASNKHFQNALGIPYSFKGDNYVGQDVNSSTTWCASCHYQGYSSGSKNYTHMIKAFLDRMLPAPPEITGHSQYGVNKSQSPDYYEHSKLSSFDDKICWNCHGGKLAEGSTSTEFLHNVSVGMLGGRNCTGCHNVGGSVAGALVNFSSVGMGMHAGINTGAQATSQNASNKPCWGCHGTLNGTWANETDQPLDDHNTTYKESARKCHGCHSDSGPLFGAKNVTDHIPSGLSLYTDVTTSKYNVTYCSYCHNNSLGASFDPDDLGSNPMNASAAHYGANRTKGMLMSAGSNSTDCNFCHKNTSNMPKWGILPESRANISNKNGSVGTGTSHIPYTTNDECYSCHGGTVANFHIQSINKGAGSGPDCRSCHNISDTDPNRGHIDTGVFNSSIHGNMNTTGGNDANEPCWGCHGNGNSEGHNTTGDAYGKGLYRNPYNCTDCHVSGGVRYAWASARNALTAAEHYSGGADIRASYDTKIIFSCLACHQNISEMRLTNNDPDAGSFDTDGDGVNGTGISAYHYGRKRPDMRSGVNTSCIYCHSNSSTLFPLSYNNRSIIEHTEAGAGNTTGGSCTGSKCHSSGLIHDTNLTKYTTQAWTPGGADYCAPCHKPGNSNATRYVHNQKHDPANSSGDRIGDCGFCHNASSQGMDGSTVRIHSPTLTNTTSSVLYGTCAGCHNGTSIYVGAAKQIYSHLPNGSQYRGNTSMSNYSCEKCHNMTTGSSMHSSGMDRSNGTCVTCHFNRISKFNATVKKIETWEYGHTYTNQKSCNITQCHNASGAALGFHLDRYAGAVVADPERVNSIWGERNNSGNGFTDTPYVDCIDCHREHNNTFPFNNTYPFNYSTNYSFNYEANHTGENKKIHSTSDSMDSCYNCHTDLSDIKNPQNRFKVHNVSIEPLLGGPACVSCHNKSAPTTAGYPPVTKKVDHTAFNLSVHSKLVNYTLWNESKKQKSVLLDSACWACHSTSLTGLPNNAHPDRGGPASLRPFQCNECHTPEGNMSMLDPEIFQRAPKIYQHYAGKSFLGDKIFNSSKECYECHENSLVHEINVSYGEYARSGEANGSHYAIREDLIHTNLTQSGCKQCHAVGGEGGSSGMKYGNAIGVPVKHNLMGINGVFCQVSCHNSNPAVNITNHDINMGLYVDASACFVTGCHVSEPCEECTR